MVDNCPDGMGLKRKSKSKSKGMVPKGQRLYPEKATITPNQHRSQNSPLAPAR